MNTIDAIKQRRSIKHFDPEHQFSDKEIDEILRLALLSPTSFNIQNWRLIVVKDEDLRQKIRQVSWDQTQVTEASLLLVLCADLKAWEKGTERYWRNAEKQVQDIMIPETRSFYKDQEQLQRDEAMRSVGIMAQTIMLTVKSLGYDSCPMIGFDPIAVAKLINLPEDHIIGMFITIGKKTQNAWPRPGQLPLNEIVFDNSF